MIKKVYGFNQKRPPLFKRFDVKPEHLKGSKYAHSVILIRAIRRGFMNALKHKATACMS